MNQPPTSAGPNRDLESPSEDLAGPGVAPTTPVKINVPGTHLMAALLGPRDELLRLVEAAFADTTIHVRGNEITVIGANGSIAARVFEELVVLLQQGHPLESRTVTRAIDMVRVNERPSEVLTTQILRTSKGVPIRAKSSGQKRYVEAIAKNVITFGIGPAGTGKSWLAVAMAVQAFQAKRVDRIILTRPAVEAGERLGFLPGDLMAKVDPYLRPLYDALYDMVDTDGTQKLLEKGNVEVAPLAFMRGRTLNNSFIILDEAQNTTPEQMKMFLTRIGFGSRAVITGDRTQVDVPGGRSGLDGLEDLLEHIDGLDFVHLTSRDVVRHRIVQDIVEAYDRASTVDANKRR
jgi:phosphate starvation-inducible PhoH-like protein